MKSVKISLFLLFIFSMQQIFATDYYVSQAGAGLQDGSSPENAAAYTASSFNAYLRAYSVASSDPASYLLNIYFDSGTYDTYAGGFSFNTIANIRQLKVLFSSFGTDSVIFYGSTGTTNPTKFLTFTPSDNIRDALQITIDNIHFRNFHSNTNDENGNGSLFSLGFSNVLNLKNATIDGVSSRRNALVSMAQYATFNVENSRIANVTQKYADFSIIETVLGGNQTIIVRNSELTNWRTESTGNSTYMFWLDDASCTLLIENSEIKNCNTGSAIIGTGENTNIIKLENTIFRNNTAYSGGVIFFGTNFSRIDILDCSFIGNRSSSSSTLIYFPADGKNMYISGSTFEANTGLSNIIDCAGSNLIIYNNTFSGNTGAAIRYTNPSKSIILNNTFYNSGDISNTYDMVIRNNLFLSGEMHASSENVTRNIMNKKYYETSYSSGIPINDIENFVDHTLTEYEPGRPKVHQLRPSNQANPILEKGGDMSATEFKDMVIYDQRKKLRPTLVSIGSCDLSDFRIKDTRYTIIYDAETGLDPYYRIDLKESILSYPDFVDLRNVQVEIINQPYNGQLNTTYENLILKFMPKTNPARPSEPAEGIIGIPFEAKYKILYDDNGTTQAVEASIFIIIININRPMGILDDELVRCYGSMQPADFETRHKYISGSYNNLEVPGYGSTFPNLQNNKFYGLSIPLAGDLDGDLKPEIVVLGIDDNSYETNNVTAKYIYILNGQTGKVIVKYPLPITWSLRDNQRHGSPSQLALIDSDRNGKAEIIVTLGYSGINNYSKRLISYEVNENTFTDREGGTDATNPNKLTLKWNLNQQGTSDIRYDAFGTNNQNVINNALEYSKPIPQIVDMDGDGNAEIVVYNKIYDAKTGRFIMKLDDLAANKTNATAYVGQDRIANQGDNDIGFAYIYDVDQDGMYDIAAGGKLYYNISLRNGTYLTKTMNDISDGHTAVADINSDGIPEIIVSGFNNTRNSYGIRVWNPGLLKKDVQGNIFRDDRDPQLIATRNVSCYPDPNNGNHSYIYIADIDGLPQNGEKFPEISVSGPRFFLTTGYNASNAPVHPNVRDSYLQSNFTYTNNSTADAAQGGIYSFTWDDNATTPGDRLKVSFIMEHQDNSVNAGFTLFDFDNDGVQDICYRDEKTLRIISASKSYVRTTETNPDVIRFSQNVRSNTGFEYPVIADIDGSASAKIIVMGHNVDGNYDLGYVYAVESSTGQLAPSPAVWNQFMYSPLKINEDLTTPMYTFNPLDPQLRFRTKTDDESWTYPYNNTITQIVKSAVFEETNASGDTVFVFRPIVLTADAQILYVKADRNEKKIRFYIKNNGDASINAQTPICLYSEGNIPSGLFYRGTVGTDVFVGDSVQVAFDLTDTQLLYDYITIRVSDATTTGSQDRFMTVYQDCNWSDNVVEAGDFVLRNVNATVAQYKSAIIDVLANDSIPEGCDARLLTANITTPDGAGILKGDFGVIEIIGNKLEYTAPGTYPGGVVEITYQITCGQQTRSANIFIYILESCYGNFSVCENNSYQVCLESRIENVKYDWYTENKDFLSNIPPYYEQLTENKILYVKPKIPEGHPLHTIDFPLGRIDIDVLPAGQGMHTLHWTGITDTDWNNPHNWVRIENGVEYPVSWAPTACVNVILPKKKAYYPMLLTPAACANIKLEDRAMIAGLHYLTYDQTQIDISLSTPDLDRFIMWSSPLTAMYTGDYHFGEDSPEAKRGDVYMNFFQSKNPDYPSGVVTENVFTSTFASLDTELPLGQAFGLKVYRSDGLKPDFRFPRAATQYKYENGTYTRELTRTNSGKFIVDGQYDIAGNISLPVKGDNDFKMIHVANPFMAYLKVDEFLAANSSVLEQSCKFWNGDINENFVSVIPPETKDQRLIIDFDQIGESIEGSLIPPLQSFFVIKKPGVNAVTTLQISDAMTTTVNSTPGGYTLFSKEKETCILRIKATQDKYTDMTVLYNRDDAKQEYNADEDARKLFNENSRIAVYTLSPSKVPLAINANGNFATAIPLGVKVKNNGLVTLSFTRFTGFGHHTIMTDHELNKSVDLTTIPSYSFMVDKTGDGVVEMNDRFTLSFTEDVSNEEIADNQIIITSEKGIIHIRSLHEEMTGYQIYNLSGQLVTMYNKTGYNYQVEVSPLSFYVVKVNLNNGSFRTAKVYVD